MDPISQGELYVGFLNFCTMLSSNHALNFVSYPMQAMVKSCKILPVMLMGLLRGTYDYGWKKYGAAGMITGGLVIFNLGNKKTQLSGEQVGLAGIGLLVVSLLFDGLVNT